MNKIKIDDDFLYTHMKGVENIVLESLPKEEDLSHGFSKRFEKKMKKLIRHNKRSPSMNNFVNYSKRVAIILFVFTSVIFATTMSVEAYRIRFFESITEVWEEFTSIIFKSEENINNKKLIPINPTYIPNGFKIIEENTMDYEHYIYWENSESIEIMYEQAKISSNAIINDTEGIELEKLLIEDLEINFFTNKNVNQIYWNDDNYIYTIISEYSKEELFKMIESIINKK